MRWRLKVWRRRWCIRRGHPMADWSPVCMSYREPDLVRIEDGLRVPGRVIEQRAWRCALHDENPTKRIDLTIDLCR